MTDYLREEHKHVSNSNGKHKLACELCLFVTIAKMISFPGGYGEFDALEFEVRTANDWNHGQNILD